MTLKTHQIIHKKEKDKIYRHVLHEINYFLRQLFANVQHRTGAIYYTLYNITLVKIIHTFLAFYERNNALLT